jgi:RNA polymerase sigma factor (sigma-70 family)
MQEGNLALMSAIDRFQPRLGYAFSTFAMRGVDAAIREAKVSLRGNIRLTEGDRRKLKSILETESHLKHILLRKPSLEEIAENLGMPVAEAELVCQASQMEGRYDLSTAEARQSEVYLPHEPPPEETEATRISSIRSSEISRALVHALGQLPLSQARILALRSGMDGDGSFSQLRCQILSKRTEPTSRNGDDSCTPSEIAAELQLSVARVSQLEAWGLRGMRQVMRGMMAQEARFA